MRMARRLAGHGKSTLPLGSLEVGSAVSFGSYRVQDEEEWELVWLVASQSGGVTTLICRDAIDQRAADAAEPQNTISQRAQYGNNDYILSNVASWLNSALESWYTPQHPADRAPDSPSVLMDSSNLYAQRPGLLCGFTPPQRDLMVEGQVPFSLPSADGQGLAFAAQRVFLPSATEVGLSTGEGEAWPLFGSANSRVCYMAAQFLNNTLSDDRPASVTDPCVWRLRTAAPDSACGCLAVGEDGSLTTAMAADGDTAIRPAVRLPQSAAVDAVSYCIL